MTSIEFLKAEYIKRGDSLPSGVFQEAKEMHKKEIMEAWEDGIDSFSTRSAEQYYQETFGSKKKIKFTEEEWAELNNGSKKSHEIIKLPQQEISDKKTLSEKYKEYKDWLNEIPQISDEEIDNAVVEKYENVGDEKLFPNHTDKDIWMNGFYEGAIWYREQLKSKQ